MRSNPDSTPPNGHARPPGRGGAGDAARLARRAVARSRPGIADHVTAADVARILEALGDADTPEGWSVAAARFYDMGIPAPDTVAGYVVMYHNPPYPHLPPRPGEIPTAAFAAVVALAQHRRLTAARRTAKPGGAAMAKALETASVCPTCAAPIESMFPPVFYCDSHADEEAADVERLMAQHLR